MGVRVIDPCRFKGLIESSVTAFFHRRVRDKVRPGVCLVPCLQASGLAGVHLFEFARLLPSASASIVHVRGKVKIVPVKQEYQRDGTRGDYWIWSRRLGCGHLRIESQSGTSRL